MSAPHNTETQAACPKWLVQSIQSQVKPTQLANQSFSSANASCMPASSAGLSAVLATAVSQMYIMLCPSHFAPSTLLPLETQELTRASRANGNKEYLSTLFSATTLFNKPHTHIVTLCPWSMQMFSFDCLPSQPSKLSEAGQQLHWLCHPWPQCLHGSGMRGTVQKEQMQAQMPAGKRPRSPFTTGPKRRQSLRPTDFPRGRTQK